MLGLLGLLVVDAKKISDFVKEHVQLNVYLQDNIGEQDLNMFLSALNESDFVKSTRYVSKEEALDSLKKELGENAVGMIEPDNARDVDVSDLLPLLWHAPGENAVDPE